ncbi:recombinase family protein, partial [Roseibium sediminicola]
MAKSMLRQSSNRPEGRLIGYARVSTDEQATEAQEMELRSAGCETIVEEYGSGALNRPGFTEEILFQRLCGFIKSVQVFKEGLLGFCGSFVFDGA